MKYKIEAMYGVYGVSHGYICKNCCNFASGEYHGKTCSKCVAYGASHSDATDWSLNNTACGLYGTKFEGTGKKPLFESLKQATKKVAVESIDGQMSLFDEVV